LERVESMDAEQQLLNTQIQKADYRFNFLIISLYLNYAYNTNIKLVVSDSYFEIKNSDECCTTELCDEMWKPLGK
jgi:hypothetical protein